MFAKQTLVTVGRSIGRYICLTRKVSKSRSLDPGKGGKGCTMQTPALAAVAVAVIVYFTIYLKTYSMAFTPSAYHITTPAKSCA
jgi:hypothetical protein